MEGLWRMLEGLPRERWPTFVRGDCSYGNEQIMTQFEERELPYLLKLRHTPKVKALVRDALRQSQGWVECADGWQAAEARLKLSGWSKERRVIIVREAPAITPVGEHKRRRRDPFELREEHGKSIGAESLAPWSGRIAVLVIVHEKKEVIQELVGRTSRQLHRMKLITERWSAQEKWSLLLTRLLRRWLGEKWLPGLPEEAHLLLSG